MKSLKQSNNKGFTIIELLIAVTIIGTLAAVAGSYYLNYKIKSNNQVVYAAYKSIIKNAYASGFCEESATTLGASTNPTMLAAVAEANTATAKIGATSGLNAVTVADLCSTNQTPTTVLTVPVGSGGNNANNYPTYNIQTTANPGAYSCTGNAALGQPNGPC